MLKKEFQEGGLSSFIKLVSEEIAAKVNAEILTNNLKTRRFDLK